MTDGATPPPDPIEVCIQRWHAYLDGQQPGGLDALLSADCVFYSPIVFAPQVGRDVTKAYLSAAAQTLAGDNDPALGGVPAIGADGGFRYLTEIAQGHHAMLEFETNLWDPERQRLTLVNGVDIITCDEQSMIVEFKVMLRPLQAVNLVHARMRDQLERMKP